MALGLVEEPPDTVELWHARLAHQGPTAVAAANESMKLGIAKKQVASLRDRRCTDCDAGGAQRKAIGAAKPVEFKATETLECLHVDLAGPVWSHGRGRRYKLAVRGTSGKAYAMFSVDEYSRAVIVTWLPEKRDVVTALPSLIRALQTRTAKKLKRCHSDGGGEFTSARLRAFMEAEGIRQTFTTADTPQHNGIV